MDAFLRGTESAGNASTRSRDTRNRIRRVFLESLRLNLQEEDLDYEHKLDESVGLDSLAVLEFITALEKEFGFAIDPEMLQLDFVRDLPRLASYIEERAARISRPPA